MHQGRTRMGADCLGFISAMLAELGSLDFLYNLPQNYGRAPQTELIDGLAHLSYEIKLQPASFLLIKFPFHKYASHGAIYTGESMIHSFQSNGKVIEHGYRAPWIGRTLSVWALPGVTYE